MDTPQPPAKRPSPARGPAPRTPRLNVDVPEGYLAVGRIVGVHGLKGEIKVELYTDFPERFEPGALLFLGDELEETEILSARPHKGNMLLKLDGVEVRAEAEAMRGQWLFVPEDEAAELEEHSYWIHDILDMEAVTETGEVLGTVVDVLFTGANEVYVVQLSGARKGELLLPAIDEVVRSVDVAARRMTVRLMAGMLDE